LQNEMLNVVKAIGSLFGFSPDWRASIKAPGSVKVNEFDEFLKG